MTSPVRLDPGRPPVDEGAAGRTAVIRGLIVVATLIAGVILVLLRDTVLPERFSYDAKGIQAIGQGTLHVVDPAYESVAAVYKALGLIDDATLASLLGFFAAFAVLAVAGRRLLRPDAALSATVLFFVAVLLSAVYLGTYSKDVFVLPIVLLAVLPGRRWVAQVLTGLAIIGYALVFRTYWFIVLGAWVALQVLLARRPRLVWLLVALLAGSVLLAGAVGVALGGSADSIRTSSNEYRVGSDDAATLITAFVPGGTLLTGMLNAPLQLLALMVPLPLMLKGGVYYAVLALVFAVFWVRTAIAVRRTLVAGPDVVERSCAALLLAFVAVQALFEPDYGSALRHLTPLLPLAVLLWARPRQPRRVD
ncbi:hypothetical protein [Amnibacterium endophyticum]|uniref:Glycosyltransferase RgtA/B/C/D-like domain-containing protein n=1 Tax=Amnibacterium endophyticum TaxID=2109337 RepID=A0ABW4L9L7_9MICO